VLKDGREHVLLATFKYPNGAVRMFSLIELMSGTRYPPKLSLEIDKARSSLR
jgi:hypothetical protein